MIPECIQQQKHHKHIPEEGPPTPTPPAPPAATGNAVNVPARPPTLEGPRRANAGVEDGSVIILIFFFLDLKLFVSTWSRKNGTGGVW